MKTISASDITIHVLDKGPRDGRVVMFANSLGTDLRVWDAILPLLPMGLRIVRFDKRGHGLSDATPAPYSIDRLVADAKAVCEGLALSDITFVGLSIGGLIGQGLAAKRPDLVRALVLMDTAAQIGTAEMWQDRIDRVNRDGVNALADPILERWFTPAFRATSPEFALWRNMLTRTTVAGYTGCCAAIAGADLTNSTRALRLPVMAMAGDQDGSTPPDLVRATADLCGAPFHLIADAGHIPCVEQPEAVAKLLTDFLERTAR
ncbi:3-oxoadipate enol-lactonase [Paracoccus sediminis]|uniref:3-oxoadipate enol-lactonase n=1 Tax=Paracoccus sediminis TaxID=1214787 RepID=A0A238WEL1_9RHOB|nr:3-oxoadipate enol-lactonase [Paracoccus sediminis]TBN50910.1 3-oxoadipate enol-lactonase [Paracoccus sediminis]SNR44791.1 3-oxoadipate enol-lactonase [Paracoccus sediminis]